MSSGTPDYLKTIRPRYGGAEISAKWTVVEANAFTELLRVVGKGMIYGGALFLDYTATQRDSYMALYIDTSGVVAETFATLNKYRITESGGHPLMLTTYDDKSFIYSIEMPYGITFESSLFIAYREAHGGTPNVKLAIVYALM